MIAHHPAAYDRVLDQPDQNIVAPTVTGATDQAPQSQSP
jgi:hypothetical protein